MIHTHNKDVFNQIAWPVNSDAKLNSNNMVSVPCTKATKINQIWRDSDVLLPNSRKSEPSFFVLRRKTGSKDVIDIIYGVSYTETLSTQDQWHQSSRRDHNYPLWNVHIP